MKFARYLEETQIPEWKKAYIDYRGLKKSIAAIRKRGNIGESTLLPPTSASLGEQVITTHSPGNSVIAPSLLALSPLESRDATERAKETDVSLTPSRDSEVAPLDLPPAAVTAGRPQAAHNGENSFSCDQPPGSSDWAVQSNIQSPSVRPCFPSGPSLGKVEDEGTTHPQVRIATTLSAGILPRLRKGSTAPTLGSTRALRDPRRSIPLMELIPMLNAAERAFFDKLDIELDKVESFYGNRETEMRDKTTALKEQLRELKDHRRQFLEAQASHPHFWSPVSFSFGRRAALATNSSLPERMPPRKRRRYKANSSLSPCRVSLATDRPGVSEGVVRDGRQANFQPDGVSQAESPANGDSPPTFSAAGMRHDPEDYQHAKKKLKKAVLECYRGLEVLNNYRTLNLIGFRKALKKFEKVTKIPAQDAYMTEKVEPSTFASGAIVEQMLHDIEHLYAARFTRGDKKRAINRLRAGAEHRSSHFSMFRTGLFVGLAIPALAGGLYESAQTHTQEAITAWGGLLYVYSLLLIPVLFALLVGLNLLVWYKSRINHTFIFELDLRTRLDSREYFEIPALLFATLCYAFWFSFARIGSHAIDPTLWPLVWLGFAAVLMLNPLPILFRPSRFWLLRNVGRLLSSGAHRVEFADFWMGDQLCSLVYTISNLYFIPCVYRNGRLGEDWQKCTHPKLWGIPFVLATLPLLARSVQSIRRWYDSGVNTHLINGGKYATGIIYYLFYFHWRHSGGDRGSPFALWCIFAAIYAAYAASWDFLMDWSVLRPHANFPLLRSELLYTNNISLYYLAMIANVSIRFIWVIYIPRQGPNFQLRTFIAGALEMLRRLQWNFFRLENEQIGNMDQYRATREVPLPYHFDDPGHESDGDEDDHRSMPSLRWRKSSKHHANHTENDSS